MRNGSTFAFRKESVLISSIGIAGPAFAYWLAAYGFKTTLVEIAPRLRRGGYVIDFWGRGFDVAERMGILPVIKREGYDITLLSKKRSKKELTKRPPFLVKSLVWKSSEKTVNGGWRDGRTLESF